MKILSGCAYYLNGNLSETFMGHTLTSSQDIKLFVLFALTTIPNLLMNNHLLSLAVYRNNCLSLLVVVTAKLLPYPCYYGRAGGRANMNRCMTGVHREPLVYTNFSVAELAKSDLSFPSP